MNTTIEDKLKHLPNRSGAYMMKDEDGGVIYVGKAASLRGRVRSYFQKGQTLSPKTVIMLSHVKDVDWLITDSEVEALMLECNLIKKYRPRYNVRLRDDKHYPYLCVTVSEAFPRVLLVRRVRSDGSRYFGPYADSSALRESMKLIRRIFRIRGCGKKLMGNECDKPCLNLHLNQCDAPCAGRTTREQYAEQVRDACLFLEGRLDAVADRLEREMNSAAETLEFERAARLRDQITLIQKLTERQKIINTEPVDQDVISISEENHPPCVQLFSIRSGKLTGEEHFFLDGGDDETPEVSLSEFVKQYYRDAAYVPREVLVSHEPEERAILEDWLSVTRGSRVKLVNPKRGQKRRLVEMAAENANLAAQRQQTEQVDSASDAFRDLEALRETLELEDIPQRIEAYDISNIQGTEAVGSMVVFTSGVPAKSQYRRFKIRAGGGPDDYGMMREVLRRRFANAVDGNAKFTALPDLILIDGGRGHLNVALETVPELSKTIQVISLAKRLEEVYLPTGNDPLLLPRDSDALRLLQRIRDEAHRFALSYHQKLRAKSMRKSVLDTIPGVGPARRKALIGKFGSVAGIRRASVKELLLVAGISQDVGQAVYDALHG